MRIIQSIRIALLLFSLMGACSLYSQNETHFNVIDRSKEFRLRIYFFITYPSCTGCIDNINTVLSSFKNEEDIEFAGFISSSDNKIDTKFFKDKYNWDFNLVNDMLGIYYQYYKIRKSNSLLILDGDGNLVSRIEFTSNPLPEIEKIIKKYPRKLTPKEYNLINDKIITKDGKELIGDNYYKTLYSNKLNKYFLMGVTNSKLIISGIDGIATDLIDLKRIMQFMSPTINSFSWLIQDSIIIGKSFGSEFNNEKQVPKDVTFFYDVINNSYWVKVITNDKLSSYFYAIYGNKLNSTLICSYNYFYNPKQINSNSIKPLTVIDTNGIILKECGFKSDIYSKYKIDDIYGIFLDFSSKNIFAYQSYSNKILKFDGSFNVMDSIELKNSNNVKLPKSDYPKDFISKDILKFANSISIFYDFKYNENNDRFLFYYEDRNSPESSSDLYSPLIKYVDYFAIYDSNGNIVKEFRIPDRHLRILRFENDTITYLVSIQNKLHIKTIKYSNQ